MQGQGLTLITLRVNSEDVKLIDVEKEMRHFADVHLCDGLAGARRYHVAAVVLHDFPCFVVDHLDVDIAFGSLTHDVLRCQRSKARMSRSKR